MNFPTINLNTHVVYPEIIIKHDTGNWVCRLYARNGETKEEWHGVVPVEGKTKRQIRLDASIAAYLKINTIIDKYEVK